MDNTNPCRQANCLAPGNQVWRWLYESVGKPRIGRRPGSSARAAAFQKGRYECFRCGEGSAVPPRLQPAVKTRKCRPSKDVRYSPFRRSAQYFFMRSDTALRAAGLIFLRPRLLRVSAVEAAAALPGRRPRRFGSASITAIALSRRSLSAFRTASTSVITSMLT